MTFWNFIAMSAGIAGVLGFLPQAGTGGNFYGFLAMSVVLFVTAGIGNGSTSHMIPAIFLETHQRKAYGKGRAAEEQAVRDANTETAAVLNLSSAVGTYGGFSIPVCYGVSISMTGAPETALYGFIVFYLTCMGLTWRYYWGHNAPMLS